MLAVGLPGPAQEIRILESDLFHECRSGDGVEDVGKVDGDQDPITIREQSIPDSVDNVFGAP